MLKRFKSFKLSSQAVSLIFKNPLLSNRMGQSNLFEKRKEALPEEDFRKRPYKGEQNKVHEFKWRVGSKHVVWKGERSVVEEGKSVYLKGDIGCLPSVQPDRQRWWDIKILKKK